MVSDGTWLVDGTLLDTEALNDGKTEALSYGKCEKFDVVDWHERLYCF